MFQLLGHDTVHSVFVPMLGRGGQGWLIQDVRHSGPFHGAHKWRVQWDAGAFWCGVGSNANFCSASLQEKNRLSWNVILKFDYSSLVLSSGYWLKKIRISFLCGVSWLRFQHRATSSETWRDLEAGAWTCCQGISCHTSYQCVQTSGKLRTWRGSVDGWMFSLFTWKVLLYDKVPRGNILIFVPRIILTIKKSII